MKEREKEKKFLFKMGNSYNFTNLVTKVNISEHFFNIIQAFFYSWRRVLKH